MSEIEIFPLSSNDIKNQQLEKLKTLFPEVFTEGNKVDWDKLKLTLGETINGGKERFAMNWPGKADCFKTIQQPSLATLVPEREESVDYDKTKNLFIEGDNLEVLKLLQKSYLGKIKMIYIDPPYNTGNDFIYPDNYSETLDSYLEYTGQVDNAGKKYSTNTDTDGRFHSKWMNMMYPRLFLAKNLLQEDGVIFISIDNNEVDNLKKICNEIFGEENFIECLIWNKRIPKNDKEIGSIHEYILIYVKNSFFDHEFVMHKDGLEEIFDLLESLKKKKVDLPKAEEEVKKFYKKKGYDRGITLYNSLNYEYRLWGKINMSWPNANTFGPRYIIKHPKTGKPVKIPDRGWRWKEDSFQAAAGIEHGKYKNVVKLYDGSFICGKIWFAKNEDTQPSSITFLDEVYTFLLRSIISLKSDGGIEVEKIFEGKNYFSYPKPSSLLKVLIKSQKEDKDYIILDFFAGSCTTAHAVLDLNQQDNGTRKFICVQLPESSDQNSEAFKAGYKTIADIGKERIRRVINKITAETEQKKEKDKINPKLFKNQEHQNNDNIDLGFKVFKLAKSNFSLWNADVNKTPEAIQQQLSLHVKHISPEAEQEAILFELLIKSGIPITTPIKTISLPIGKGKKTGVIHSINDNELVVCLEKQLTHELIKGIAELKPQRVICLDEGFQNNDQLKTNAALIMKSNGVIKFQTV